MKWDLCKAYKDLGDRFHIRYYIEINSYFVLDNDVYTDDVSMIAWTHFVK